MVIVEAIQAVALAEDLEEKLLGRDSVYVSDALLCLRVCNMFRNLFSLLL